MRSQTTNTVISCILFAFTLIWPPISSYAVEGEIELQNELAKHLVCHPTTILKVEEQSPSIDQRELCLATVYQGTGATPLWVTVSGPGYEANTILFYLQNADKHGLYPVNYEVPRLLELWESKDYADLAKLDTLITYNLVRYAHDISHGQIKPHNLDPKLFPEAGDVKFNPLLIIQQIKNAVNIDDHLASLPPQHHHYSNLVRALEHYRTIARNGDFPVVQNGPSIRPGDRDARIPSIVERLKRSGDLHTDALLNEPLFYSEEIVEAVKRFQSRHGLLQDGIIGKNTRRAMNVPINHLIETIRINMARWRWQAHDLGEKYILVNIAGFNLQAYTSSGNHLVLDIPVIVGKEQHQTPVFSDSIKYVDVNPFWNITPSIAKNEELPKLRENPFHLAERNIRLFTGWGSDAIELDSTEIDWDLITPGMMAGYRLRQDPGPWNALGKIKFVFPNKYSVYMHDTPSPYLFRRTQRDFSHGCIRVSAPLALAFFILENSTENWTRERITAVYNRSTRKVIRLSNPMPIHITYQTTWVDKDGRIHFNGDIYARDARLLNIL